MVVFTEDSRYLWDVKCSIHVLRTSLNRFESTQLAVAIRQSLSQDDVAMVPFSLATLLKRLLIATYKTIK